MALSVLRTVRGLMLRRRSSVTLGLCLLLSFFFLASHSFAVADLTLFGPERYDRLKGKPTVYTDTFERCHPSYEAVLRVTNGDGKSTRIKAASISVNGVEVAAENEFKQQIPAFEKSIAIQEHNELKVVLKSGMQDDPNAANVKDQSFLVIEIIGKGCDSTPPVISNPEPADGSLLNTATPRIAAQYADEAGGSGIDLSSAKLIVDGSDVTSSASVTASGIAYTPSSSLSEGVHSVTVAASDNAQNAASLSWQFTTDTVAPAEHITSHQTNQYLNTQPISVSGTVDDGSAAVTVNGQAVAVTGGAFGPANVSLVEGENTLLVEARDAAGNIGRESITVTLDTISPEIRVTSPEANAYLNTPTITVSGTVVDANPAGLWINEAPVILSGQSFSKTGVALTEGQTTVTLRAADLAGNEATINVPLTLDTIRPVVTINTPVTNSLVNTPQITVMGRVSEENTTIVINGRAAQATGQDFTLPGIALTEGANTIAATATDRAGNSGSASVNATLDSIAPDAPVLSVPAAAVKVPTTTVSGTVEPGSTVNLYLMNSQGSQALAGNGMADSQGAFSFPDIALAEGENSFTATATDAAGNTSPVSAPVSVIFDTKPPVITVTSPGNNFYTNQNTMSVIGSVDEAATIEINGTAVTLDGLTFQHTVTITSGLNSIQITATDTAGNSSTATVLITLDTTPPAVSITSPLSGLLTNNPAISVSGTVSEPVSSVTVNGMQAQVSGSAFSLATFTLAEGQNAITAEAVDRAGNTGSSSVNVTLDTQVPAVSITAPAMATAGATLGISTSAIDATGITLIEVSANGMPLWSFTPISELSTQNSFSYTVSPDLVSGSVVGLLARVYDAAGNTGTAAAQVQITGGPSGPGFIQGEVYDDSKGLRLEGAAADFFATDGHGLTRITTGTDGGYFTEAAAGDYTVTISKPGFTTIERQVTVKPEKKTVAIDARLTPVSAAQNLIGSAGGTATAILAANGSESTRIELTVPVGAVNEPIDLRITPVSNQGLIGLLPSGWSPIGIVDIRSFATENTEITEGTSFGSQGASLKIPITSILGLSPSSSVNLVRYDNASHRWIVQSVGTVSDDGHNISVSIPSTGQYAFILPDSTSSSALSAGSAVQSLSASSAVNASDVSAAGRVVPAAAPPSAGLKAVGEIVLSPSPLGGEGSLFSGLIVNGRGTERFDLFSGDAVVPSEYTQDLVLYRHPCVTNFAANEREFTQINPETSSASSAVKTTFPVTPSREYTITELMMGTVGVEITLPEAESGGTLVGADGGRLLDSDGNVLAIPAGALSQTVPVETKTVPISVLSNVVGSDFTLIRAVSVNLGGRTLSSSAELSVSAPVGVDSSLPLIVAKSIDVRGVQRLKLVALARLSGSLITSYPFSEASVSSVAKGVDSSGTYFFLQAKAPLGFVTGAVTNSSGAPFAYALTTSNTCSLADLTGLDGKYLIASTISGFIATALDIYRNDVGTGNGSITAASQAVTVNLSIQATPPRITSFAPADNATGVEPNASIVINFSEPVDKTTITTANIILKDNADAILPGTFSINADGTVVTLYPASLLKSEARHSLTISRNIKDLQSYLMGQDVTSTFTVKDTTPPPMPPAGSITASFPDADGYVTVTATQGSAEATGTVLIINDMSGEIVAVRPNSNGSFTGRIQAQLGDDIKIVSMDAAGNQTLISYVVMKSADGKYLVSAKGGVVEGEGGTRLEIPEGALAAPTVIKISPVSQEQLPQDNPAPKETKFLAAVNIDTGGVKFRKAVQFSVPAPSDVPADVNLFVAQPADHVNPDGTQEKVYVIKDSAKLVDSPSGKRLSTACWPFDGVAGLGTFAFYSPGEDFTGHLGGSVILSGYTFRDMDGDWVGTGKYESGDDVPVANAPVRCPGARNLLVYSEPNGHYATYVFYPQWGCGSTPVTATNPQTKYQETIYIYACSDVNHENGPRYRDIKLGDANSVPPDNTPPAVDLNMQVAPGQAGSPQFVAGTIPADTDILPQISIVDRDIASATIIITRTTPDGPAQSFYGNMLGEYAEEVVSYVSAETPVMIKKFTYGEPVFVDPVSGSLPRYFRPRDPGAYTITVEARDSANNRSSRSITVRAVLAGQTLSGVDGPPTVDEVIPADGAREIMVTMPVMVTFNEPVEPASVNADTLKLLDHGPAASPTILFGTPVPASIYLSTEGGRMKAAVLSATLRGLLRDGVKADEVVV